LPEWKVANIFSLMPCSCQFEDGAFNGGSMITVMRVSERERESEVFMSDP
jgi:hypothetical protein